MASKANKQPISKVPSVGCPKCDGRQPFRGTDAIYFCDRCRMQFDLTDDGGDYSDRDPSARLERAEREQERRRGSGPGSDNRIHRHARGYR